VESKKAALNISVSIIFRIIIIILSLFVRRYLVFLLGAEANGLYSLYVSILGVLSIAELGLGTAIIYSMYKPIVEKDNKTLTGLYHLYKKYYFVIGLIIFIGGLVVIPFLPYLAKENTGSFDLYLTYFIYLASMVITYLFAYKTSTINAFKNNYITTIIRSIGLIIEAVLQIIVLLVIHSFTGFFMAILIGSIFQWIATDIVFKKKYKNTLTSDYYLPNNVKKEVSKNTKAMFLHKIGGTLSNATSSLLISALISVIVLGKYANYILVMTGMIGLLNLVFSSITSIVGHYFIKHSKEHTLKLFNKVYLVNIIMGFIFLLGFHSTIENIIVIIFGRDQLIDSSIVIFITVSYFIRFMRQTVLLFKDASGNFYHDRYKPLIQGVASILLSLLLIKFMGIIGLLVSHIVTDLFIAHIVEPYVLFKYGFNKSSKDYFLYNYGLVTMFVISVLVINLINYTSTNIWMELLINGSLSIIISIIFITIICLSSRRFREAVKMLLGDLRSFVKEINKKLRR